LNTKVRTMSNIANLKTKLLGLEALAEPLPAVVRIAPVMRADPSKPDREERRRTHQTAVASYLYMFRLPGADDIGVVPPAYLEKRDDLFATGRRHPLQKFERQHTSGRLLWDEADAATRYEPDEASAIHAVMALPPIPQSKWQLLIERFVDNELVSQGMIVDYAIHCRVGDDGEWTTRPHVHLLATARRWRTDQRKGSRQRTWLCSKAAHEALEDAWHKVTGLPRRAIVI
jgi:MobA/MobL family